MSSLAVSQSKVSFTCSFCSKTLQSHRGLLIHIHKMHQKNGSCGHNDDKKVRCQEASCDFKCQRLSQLREHLSQCHGFSFTEMVIQFDNASQFRDYLRKFERQNNVEFYINTANVNIKSKVVYYRCNRSGFYRVSKQVVQRRTKNQGSCKIEGHCTAYVKTKEIFETGKVTMQLCNSHYGHDLQLVHLRVPKEDKRIISDSLKKGLDFEEIIEVVRESKPQTAQRTNLIKSKDVYNLMVKEHKKRSKLQSSKTQVSSILPLPKISKVKVVNEPIRESRSTANDKGNVLFPVVASSIERLRKEVLKNLQAMMNHLASLSNEKTLTEFLHFTNEWKSRLNRTNIGLEETDSKIIKVSLEDLNFNGIGPCHTGEHSIISFEDDTEATFDGVPFQRKRGIKSSHDDMNTERISPKIDSCSTTTRGTVFQKQPVEDTTLSHEHDMLSANPMNAPCEVTDLPAFDHSVSDCSIRKTDSDHALVRPVASLAPERDTPEALASGFVLVSSLEPVNLGAPQILDRAFTTFSKDGETCFLHVGDEMQDKDIQIVIA